MPSKISDRIRMIAKELTRKGAVDRAIVGGAKSMAGDMRRSGELVGKGVGKMIGKNVSKPQTGGTSPVGSYSIKKR
jgi:hypothetical protein